MSYGSSVFLHIHIHIHTLVTQVSPLDDSLRNDSAVDTADRVSNANESGVVPLRRWSLPNSV